MANPYNRCSLFKQKHVENPSQVHLNNKKVYDKKRKRSR